jgi:hypothetical protein
MPSIRVGHGDAQSHRSGSPAFGQHGPAQKSRVGIDSAAPARGRRRNGYIDHDNDVARSLSWSPGEGPGLRRGLCDPLLDVTTHGSPSRWWVASLPWSGPAAKATFGLEGACVAAAGHPTPLGRI